MEETHITSKTQLREVLRHRKAIAWMETPDGRGTAVEVTHRGAAQLFEYAEESCYELVASTQPRAAWLTDHSPREPIFLVTLHLR